MRGKLPTLAVILGLGGLIPFMVCGFGSVWLRPPGEQAFLLTALIAYAATILSFLGAVHWGFALEDEVGLADLSRIGLGVIPAIVGWVALLLTFAAQPDIALALLAAGFSATVAVEERGARSALQPRGYMGLRWVLTAVVLAVLLSVLATRTMGLHVR